MVDYREILRLHNAGYSNRSIASAVQSSRDCQYFLWPYLYVTMALFLRDSGLVTPCMVAFLDVICRFLKIPSRRSYYI